MDITLSWSNFKTELSNRKLGITSYGTANDSYYIIAHDGILQFSCIIHKDGGADQIDFETNYQSTSGKSPAITTQYEKNDKDLKIACDAAAVNATTGQASISLKVPGVMANGDGRYIAGGSAFFDTADSGDMILSVAVVDVDNVLGYGANYVVKTYTDSEQPTANQGWYIPPKKGQVEVEAIGGYGFIPAQLYVQITAQKVSTNKTGNFYVNLFWGKKSP